MRAATGAAVVRLIRGNVITGRSGCAAPAVLVRVRGSIDQARTQAAATVRVATTAADACRLFATLPLRQRLDGGGSQTRVRSRRASVAGERRPLDANALLAARREQLIRGVDLGESPTGLFAQPFVALEAIGMPYADEIEISLLDLFPVCRRMQIENPQGPREGHRTLIVHMVEAGWWGRDAALEISRPNRLGASGLTHHGSRNGVSPPDIPRMNHVEGQSADGLTEIQKSRPRHFSTAAISASGSIGFRSTHA